MNGKTYHIMKTDLFIVIKSIKWLKLEQQSHLKPLQIQNITQLFVALTFTKTGTDARIII